MLIHGFNHHHRDLLKNLFLGETLQVFANPPSPDAAAQPGAEQAQPGPEGTARAQPGSGEDKETEFYKELKQWVPKHKEYIEGEHLEVMDEWLRTLADVNGLQGKIERLLELKTRLKSPKYIQDLPNIQAKYQEAYGQLAQIRRLKDMNRDMAVDWAGLEEKARTTRNLSTKEIQKDIDAIIARLVIHRRTALRVLREQMKEDFKRRLDHFKEEWTNNPPPGYEKSAKDWISAADQILKHLDKLDFYDSDAPELPTEGDKVFKRTKAMWEGIRDMERTMEIYHAGQKHGLTPQLLEADLNRIEQEKASHLTPELIAENKRQADNLLSRLDQVLGAYRGTLDDPRKSAEERDKDKKGLEEIAAFREQIVKQRDLDQVVNDIINQEDEEGKTRGLRQQLEFIKTAQVSETERNQMMFRFKENLDLLDSEIKGVQKNMETVYPDMLKKIALVEAEMKQGEGRKTKKIYWLAAQPTWGIVSHAIQDVFKKNYDRDTQRKAGIWGSKAFKFLEKLPTPIFKEQLRPLKEIAGKMAIEQEHAETTDYQEWMKQHEHAAVSHLFHVMHETTNVFEFRGVIELLAKKGRMRFDDEGFYKQLNRWQKSIPVPTSKYWHQNQANRTKSEDMIRDVIYMFYGDIDIYQTWRSQNTSAIESEKGKWANRLAEVSEVKGGLESEIKPILAEFEHDHAAGKHFSDADPVKYEAVILYAIQQGKMDAEDVLYYVIQGIGKGLIALERGSAFTNLNNNYPAIEIFAEKTKRGAKPTLEDVQEWSQMNKEEYLDWYHSYVMYLPKVQQRLIKAQSQGLRLDHDYFTAFAGYLNTSTVKRLLQSNSDGGFGLQETAVQNGTVGMLFALDTLAESYYEYNDDRGKRALSTMVETIMTFDGIIGNRVYTNQTNFYRASHNTLDTAPRYAGAYGMYGRGKMTTRDHLTTMKKHLGKLDFDPNFPMIQKLLNNEFASDGDAQKFAEGIMLKYPGIFGQNPAPTSKDKLYECIGVYIDYAIKNNKPSIKAFIDAMQEEHHRAGADVHSLRHSRDHKMQHFRQEFSKKMERGELVEEHGHGDHGHGHGGGHGGHGGGHGEHPEEGGDHHGEGHGGGGHGDDHGAQGATQAGGGPTAHGSTHGH